MTDFDYPPTRSYTLAVALEHAESRVEECETHLEQFQAADDTTDSAIADARGDLADARNQRDAIEWAIGQFGDQAEVTLSAFTAQMRGRVQDALRNSVMGELGPDQSSVYFVAGAIDDAPWIDGGEDFVERAQITGQLPPALVDWLAHELEALNDLTAGN